MVEISTPGISCACQANNMNRYSEQQITEWLELAREVGITKATRELGYPNSWITGKRWADNHHIDIDVDEIRSKAANMREWYKSEEKLIIAQEELNRIHEALLQPGLVADDLKKLADAYKRTIEAMQLIDGKATTITETQTTDAFDSAYLNLIREEQGT